MDMMVDEWTKEALQLADAQNENGLGVAVVEWTKEALQVADAQDEVDAFLQRCIAKRNARLEILKTVK